jgi:hypothetical protein
MRSFVARFAAAVMLLVRSSVALALALYAAGRCMLESFPYVPLGGHVRMGVAIFSYSGAITFGVTGDYDAAPDPGALCGGIERAIAELVDLDGPRARRARQAGRRASVHG